MGEDHIAQSKDKADVTITGQDTQSFGGVPLALLNPDVNGDGKVSKDEKWLHELFMKADVDKSGFLSVSEVRAGACKRRGSSGMRLPLALNVHSCAMVAQP